jgi:hypothetical protein
MEDGNIGALSDLGLLSCVLEVARYLYGCPKQGHKETTPTFSCLSEQSIDTSG